jgi:transposase
MRKAVNGLVIILLAEFQQNPQSGDVYLFVNRNHNKIKGLIWDNNGFVLYYKRLEKGRFNYSKYLKEDKIEVSEKQLRALLMGLDFYLFTEHSLEKYRDFF